MGPVLSSLPTQNYFARSHEGAKIIKCKAGQRSPANGLLRPAPAHRAMVKIAMAEGLCSKDCHGAPEVVAVALAFLGDMGSSSGGWCQKPDGFVHCNCTVITTVGFEGLEIR